MGLKRVGDPRDPDPAAQSARIDALEMRVMHQDQVIDDLNATITAQWRQIDGLARRIESLDDRLRESSAGGPLAPERPPPHY